MTRWRSYIFDDDNMWSEYHHSSAPYSEVEQASPAAQPLDFPAPVVGKASFAPIWALDHRTRRVHHLRGVLLPSPETNLRIRHSVERAYLVKKKIGRSTYGTIRICLVLKKMEPMSTVSGQVVEWVSTGELVAIKASSWERIYSSRGRNLEDPLKEVAALQFVGNYHDHILGCIEVLQDEDYLYTVMPYCSGGDLYSKILGPNKNRRNSFGALPDEEQARTWFLQLLRCLIHLEKKGVCHRDISLENLMLNERNELVLIDFGLALRIPYIDSSNLGGVADVSEGTCRRLIKKQGQSGNLTYLAPEIVQQDDEFDGFAVDLWSVGVILFILLVGRAPFEWAHSTDYRFQQISKGRLRELLRSMDIKISDDACHLLQNMLLRNPRKRLTLSQVLSHPWVAAADHEQCINDSPYEQVDEIMDTPRKFFSPKGYLTDPPIAS